MFTSCVQIFLMITLLWFVDLLPSPHCDHHLDKFCPCLVNLLLPVYLSCVWQFLVSFGMCICPFGLCLPWLDWLFRPFWPRWPFSVCVISHSTEHESGPNPITCMFCSEPWVLMFMWAHTENLQINCLLWCFHEKPAGCTDCWPCYILQGGCLVHLTVSALEHQATRNPYHHVDAIRHACQHGPVWAVYINVRSHNVAGGPGLKPGISRSTCWVCTHSPPLRPWKALHSQSGTKMRADACPSPWWQLDTAARQQQQHLTTTATLPTTLLQETNTPQINMTATEQQQWQRAKSLARTECLKMGLSFN